MPSYKKAFSLVELLVTIGIFTLMTGFVAVKYGNFSKNMTINNLAYDIALTIREAQSYGVSVSPYTKVVGGVTTDVFDVPYGVHFDIAQNDIFTLFADADKNGRYTSLEKVRQYTITGGTKIEKLCHDTACTSDIGLGGTGKTHADVWFRRPNPAPVITSGISGGATYLEIRLVNPDATVRKKVVVRSSGQISIEEI